MSNIPPDNIALVTLPRTGSSSLLTKLTLGMKAHYGNDNVKKLYEAISAASVFGGNHYTIRRRWRRFPDMPVMFNNWIIDNNNHLIVHKSNTSLQHDISPDDEYQNRINLIRNSTWDNHVVFKHITSANIESGLDFMDAILNSNSDFHYVVLHRPDIINLLASNFFRIITTRKKHKENWRSHRQTPHGIYTWDGEYLGEPEKEQRISYFINYTRDIASSYVTYLQRLPKNKTVALETSEIDATSKLYWPDGTVLDIADITYPKRMLNVSTNKYIDTRTMKQVKPKDMLHPEIYARLEIFAEELEEQYNWQELLKIMRLV